MTSKVVPHCVAVNLALLLLFILAACSSSPTTDDESYVEQARTAKEAEEITEAHSLAQKAIDESRRTGEARRIMAQVLRIRAAEELEAGEAAKAHATYLQAAEQEPTTRRRGHDLSAALEAGIEAGVDDGDLLALAERAIEAAPQKLELRREAARLAEDTGDDASAATHYQWVLSAEPDDMGAALRLGIIYLALDRPSDAAAVLEVIYDREPENIQAALNLAEAYTEAHRYHEAAELFEAMLQLVPDHPGVLRQYANLEQARGNHSRARQLRQQASDASPGIEEREMRPLR